MRENGADKTFSFADFELNSTKRRLLRNGEFVSLNSKTLDLLLVLVENCGKIIHKDELLDKVWEGQFVEENNLTVHISALRKIFGEKKGEPKFILTIPGKGYSFIHEVLTNDSPFTLENQPENYSLVATVAFDQIETDESFIGRKNEIAEIKKLLRQNDVNLVTLTGAGGTGKTCLAQAVSKELRADFSGSVFFVELAAVNDAEFVISAIAQTLDVTESSGKSLLESVTEFLRGRRTLLVLDNFEHLLSAAPLVKELLATADLLKILVTSRAPLHLNIEREFKVLPLDFPADSAISIDEAIEFSAVKLFCKRAQSVKPIFLLSKENFSTVAAICRRLDGLPLAIELAAARVKLLSPQAILERLENSLQLLTGGAKDSPARQRTIRNAIQWSYDLLEENEQKLFRRLAIFAGGFTVEAAEAVVRENKDHNKLTTNHRPPTTALDLLDSLIDNNLLVSREQTDGNVRLRMLEVVREFAFEVLAETDELFELQKIHAAYFLTLAENAEEYLLTDVGSEWLEKLEYEHDNFRVALAWALKNDSQTASRIAAALRFFWLNHSHLSEGFQWSQAALQVTENTVSEARSKLLLSNGLFLRHRGNLAEARENYEKTLAESKKLNDLTQIIKANHGLAAVAILQKDFSTSQVFSQEALDLSRQLNDEMQIAYSLCSLGDLEMSKKNLSSARPILQECLQISKKLGNERLLTTTFYNLGTIDYHEKEYDSAIFNFTQSLQIARKMGNKTMISCALDGFAALAAVSENAELAATLSGAAEKLREEVGFTIEPAEEIFRNDYLSKIRANLNEKMFSALYAKGKAMNSDEVQALINSQNLAASEFYYPNEPITEIIIEQHKIERITIEEEVQLKSVSPLFFAEQKKTQLWLAILFGVLILLTIGFGYWIWKK